MEPSPKLSAFLYLTRRTVTTALLALFIFAFVPVAEAQDSERGLPGLKLPDLPPSEELNDGSSKQGGNSAFSLPDDEDDIFATDNEEGGKSFEFEQTPEELEALTRKEAFDAALQGLLPLKPGEIRELLEHFDRTQESVEVPVHPYPKPEVTVETISLDPGAKPLTIKVAHGHVTTVNFVDTSGAPWPVENITWAGNFEVVETEGTGEGDAKYSNILRISPESEFAYGNMSIMMIGLRTPIIMTLESSRDIVHYRFDAIIPEEGPFAEVPIINNQSQGGGLNSRDPFVSESYLISAGDENITSVLEGIIPPGGQRLAVSGVDGRTSAYRFNGLTYIRTPHTLLSPGWNSSMTSADGMHVYAMEDAPVLILSDNGRTVRARISDRKDIINE